MNIFVSIVGGNSDDRKIPSIPSIALGTGLQYTYVKKLITRLDR